MNIDEHPAIPGQMGIQSIPAVIAFVGGQPPTGSWARSRRARSTPSSTIDQGVPAAGEPKNPSAGLAADESDHGRDRLDAHLAGDRGCSSMFI